MLELVEDDSLTVKYRLKGENNLNHRASYNVVSPTRTLNIEEVESLESLIANGIYFSGSVPKKITIKFE